MGPHSLSEIISVSVKEAEKFISAFLGKVTFNFLSFEFTFHFNIVS